ncbi:DUF3857 domain-containing transglutaminase family protein [Odoribacter lunatus]|uniref:DUF3857 domain-containing transglutaminase family protein n=1 Tax=Odoribacter lunatus TaxID=2941335 RepID=UPI00204208E5|nr:DUF3857 and transglutaminase domain-containing protein [Odoribacter lunatus]
MKYHLLFLVIVCFIHCPISTWGQINDSLLFSEKSANYNVIHLLDSTSVEVNENGAGTFHIHRITKILKTAGALSHRVIKFDYDPLTAFAEFKYVKIKQANGKTRFIAPKTACDYVAPARAIYWGARQIMIEPGRLEPGDTIEYEISKKGFTYALLNASEDEERFIPPMKGQFYDIIPFWNSEPVLKKVYQVSLPAEKTLKYQFYQGTCHFSKESEANRQIYKFTVNHILPFEKEPNMLDLYDVAPKLMMSTTSDWKAKSRWFYNVNEDYGSFSPTPEAQAKVDLLLQGAKTEMEKISILTHWVADNMRYSGISMGKGEGYTLHNTQMNFTDRCGVCKDKAALLISMLRMAGFEAYPAMTMAGSRVEAIPADHFNHSVAVVKLSDGTYMPLDPTWVPFIRELWSSAEQQQHYLPGLPEGSDLLITPISPAENHYVKINVTSSINKKGVLQGTLILEAEGQSDANIRRIFTNGYQRDWENAIEKELLNVSPRAQLIQVNYGKNPRDYLAGPFHIKIKFVIPDYAITGENIISFKPISLNNLFNNVRSFLRINTFLKERKYGFKDACSRMLQINETIHLPKGYKMKQPERKDQITGNAADFEGTLYQKENVINLYHSLILKKRVYDADDWMNFRNAVNAHKSYGEDIILENN